MDKLAKVAAVTVVACGAAVASILSYGVLQMAASEPRVRMGKTVPAFEAAIQLPATPLLAPMAEAKPPETAPPPKRDLAQAFGTALKVEPKKLAAPPLPAAPPANVTAPDELDVGFKAPARGANLGERGVKSTSMQQTGGAERQRLAAQDDASVHFEVDLAAPR